MALDYRSDVMSDPRYLVVCAMRLKTVLAPRPGVDRPIRSRVKARLLHAHNRLRRRFDQNPFPSGTERSRPKLTRPIPVAAPSSWTT